MKKYLIVNADDYAMTSGVNQGIIEAHLQGIVTSTTVMATGAALDDGLARLAEAPQLSTGCHLVLIGDRPLAPLAQVRSLVTANGAFPRTLTAFLQQITWRKIALSEIIIEFRTNTPMLIPKY
jgi:chitin disaccharide deacetylase